jgi:hypothetical protein
MIASIIVYSFLMAQYRHNISRPSGVKIWVFVYPSQNFIGFSHEGRAVTSKTSASTVTHRRHPADSRSHELNELSHKCCWKAALLTGGRHRSHILMPRFAEKVVTLSLFLVEVNARCLKFKLHATSSSAVRL